MALANPLQTICSRCGRGRRRHRGSGGAAARQLCDRRSGRSASVLDAQRIPVTPLGAADFVVREGSVEREVTAVSPASYPLRIAVLVDTSQSMEPYISDVRRALHAYVRQVNRRRHRPVRVR